MVRVFTTKHPCPCSVEEFWGLREDPEWDQYNGELDGQWFTVSAYQEGTDPQNGEVTVKRSHVLKSKVNPIPGPIRKLASMGDDFSVKVHAQWYKKLYTEEYAMSLTVTPPVLPDRIKVYGEQWAERVDDNNCNLCTRMEIAARVPAPGTAPTSSPAPTRDAAGPPHAAPAPPRPQASAARSRRAPSAGCAARTRTSRAG